MNKLYTLSTLPKNYAGEIIYTIPGGPGGISINGIPNQQHEKRIRVSWLNAYVE